MSRRHEGRNTRQRYQAEYRESRMFSSYLDSDYDFGGDAARRNGYRSWQMRFSTLPKMPRHHPYRLVERDVADLHRLWPTARNIQCAPGHCQGCDGPMYSFQLPPDAWKKRSDGSENCGYWCADCGWSNAGSREVTIRK